MGENATYSINDLERLTGVKAHTIRMWERRYGICEPGRSNAGIRHYCDEDLRHMLNISILRKNGYKISEIANLCRKELGNKVLQEIRTGSGDQRIEEMIVTMIDLDENGFREILNSSLMEMGIEDTFTRLIYPFFHRIGIMWQSGSINPAQEHFVSNIIRQRLIVAINNLEQAQGPGTQRFILFLPENEMHELGLLLYSYIIKKSGHRVFYLGQSTPLECVRNVYEAQGGDALLTTITSAYSGDELASYLVKLTEEFPSRPILLTGLQVWQEENPIPVHPMLIRLSGMDALKAYLAGQVSARAN